MADGNVGSLFMTLGLKDEISIGLDKVAKKLSGAQKYTDELQSEVANLRKELKSVSGTDISGPFKKSLEFIKKYDESVYNTITRTNRLAYALRGITKNNDGKINIKLSNIPVAIRELAKLNQELNKIEDKDEKRAFKTSISNATDYLKLLQTIERKKAELNEIALSSRNIDKGVIASARSAINSIQSEISRQLFNIQNGSIVHTDLMPNIKKLLSMSITEMGDYMRNLKKDNPLSVFVNSADMLTSKIAAANKKILEMQALMRGSKVPGLFDTSALNGLRGVVGKMQSLINKEGKGEKTDISKINRLVSEYAKLTSQAELATSTFRRMSREYDNASARLVSWYSKYRELQSIRDKRVSLYLDTKDVDTELNRIRAIFSELNAIRQGLKSGNDGFIGMLGSRGTGVDTRIYDNVVKSAKEGVAKQEKLDKAIDKSIAKREKADADEYNRQKRQTEQRLSDINREGMALQKNAEIQQRYSDAIDKAISKKIEAQNKYQSKRDIEQLQFEASVNAAIERRNVLRQEEQALSNDIYNRYKRELSEIISGLEKESSALLKNKQIRDAMSSKKSALDDWMTRNYYAGGYFGDSSLIEKKLQGVKRQIEEESKIAKKYEEEIARIKSSIQEATTLAHSLSPGMNGRNAYGIMLDGDNLSKFKMAMDALSQYQNQLKSMTDGWSKIAADFDTNKIKELLKEEKRLSEYMATLRSASLPSDPYNREKALLAYKNEVIKKNEELLASERRIAEQIAKTNADRRSAVAQSRADAERALSYKLKELVEQRRQLADLYARGKATGLGEERLNRVRNAYSELTQQIIRMKSAMQYTPSLPIREIFSMSRSVPGYGVFIKELNKELQSNNKNIEQTGQKIQSSLVRGFKDANNAAGRLNSTIQDLKSLFLPVASSKSDD